MNDADIAIIGAGIAGASLAAAIGDAARVVLIEAEAQPGYHSTGRSAAFWSETYGGPAIQPLTSASEKFLDDGGFLGPRGALMIADSSKRALLDDFLSGFEGSGVALTRIERSRLAAIVPALLPRWTSGVEEPSCRDIDVAALHAHYLAAARRSGARLMCDAEVHGLRHENAVWTIETRDGIVKAPVIVNAAGAWATGIAAMAGASPIDIDAYRRTVVQLQVDPPAAADMPMVIDVAGTFYIKPEAGGRLWLSPHDEVPTPACDAVPEELDIAIAIDRFEKAFDWRIVKIERSWAGLRSFAPDRVPVYGFDRLAPGFFWFAGQGGFGIQTAPAAAEFGASLILKRTLPAGFERVDPVRYSPDRF
jgi:D-arginine dehydrogenase